MILAQSIQTSVPVLIGFSFADGCFTQQINRRTASRSPQVLQYRHRVVNRISGDKRIGHARELPAQYEGPDVGSDPCGRKFLQRPLEGLGKNGSVTEVFGKESSKLFIRFERWEHVHKAEELNFEILILHAPVHEQVIPPALTQDGRGAGFTVLGQRAADVPDGRFEERIRVHGSLLPSLYSFSNRQAG